MCNRCEVSDPFDSLPESDDLDALIAAPKAAEGRPLAPLPIAGHSEPCPKCRGRGRFISYSGRDCGPCFTCKGAGKLTFKQPAQVRQANRDKAAARKVAKAAESLDSFKAANPDVMAWIERNPNFSFAVSMRDAIAKYGHLTDRQLAACVNCIEKEAARNATREAEKAARESAAVAIDVSKIQEAFAHAMAEGKNAMLKVRFAGFAITPAKASSRNAGALYVKGDGGVYLGKIADGRFFQSRDCTPEQESAFREMCADPKAAAIAYGIKMGRCSVCGAGLTNQASVEAGIGPICAGKMGW